MTNFQSFLSLENHQKLYLNLFSVILVHFLKIHTRLRKVLNGKVGFFEIISLVVFFLGF